MKIREHRGSLLDSMKTVCTIEPTLSAVCEHISKCGLEVTKDMITVEKYGPSIDVRNGWNTHVILIDSLGIFGFTDSPIKRE